VGVPDDGAVRAGAPLRYTDNGDGTVTDDNTGLMWEVKNDDAPSLHDKDATYRWSGDGSQETIWDWLDGVNAEGGTGFAGYDDWRIPNVKELMSIVDFSRSDPSVHPAFDTQPTRSPRLGRQRRRQSRTVASKYWTSTPAVFVHFGRGYAIADHSTSLLFVRAVRG
jgi:hypothetical protein